jgi:hypothetical protein
VECSAALICGAAQVEAAGPSDGAASKPRFVVQWWRKSVPMRPVALVYSGTCIRPATPETGPPARKAA